MLWQRPVPRRSDLSPDFRTQETPIRHWKHLSHHQTPNASSVAGHVKCTGERCKITHFCTKHIEQCKSWPFSFGWGNPLIQHKALYYCSDLTLSQEFQPMSAQLSMKTALPLARNFATASCRSSKTGIYLPPYNAIQRNTLLYIAQWQR